METKNYYEVKQCGHRLYEGQQLVPIHPKCDALAFDAHGQKQRIERNEILGPVAFFFCMIHATERMRKTYDMYAIPNMYIFGWLFSIDTSKVTKNAREAACGYQSGVLQSFVPSTSPTANLPQTEQEVHVKREESDRVPGVPAPLKDQQKLMNRGKV